MEKVQIELTHNNSVAKVILNDGKGNILDSIMMKELHQVFAQIKNDNNIKLITFEGAGKHFSFGASVVEHTKDKCNDMLSSFHKLFYEIIEMTIPTMAKISGQCLGGGMELALMCNFLFADKTAMLGQPEILLGVFPPPASLLLPLKIGATRAEELILTGNSINAIKAKEIGLINEVFENKEDMDNSIDEWVSKNILNKSAVSLKQANKASRIIFNQTILNLLPLLEKQYLNELMNTSDANEGINSFLEKRKPIWENT